MTIMNVIEEMFDISKLKQAKDIDANVKKISQFVDANRDATGPIQKEVSNLRNSFAELLAAAQIANNQEQESEKQKTVAEKKKAIELSKNRAGIGTTIPIEKSSEAKEDNKTE